MKNLDNKQIIKINNLKFKKTPGMINFAKQIKLKFITQKRSMKFKIGKPTTPSQRHLIQLNREYFKKKNKKCKNNNISC